MPSTHGLNPVSPPGGWGCGSWEHEKSRRALKWREEQRKESYTKDDSEKDSDTGDDQPDILEPPEVASARESIAALVGEQKKLRKQKVPRVGHRESGFERPEPERAAGRTRGMRPSSSGHKSSVTLLSSLVTSLCLKFLLCKMGGVMATALVGLLGRLNKCLSYPKDSKNGSQHCN